MTCAAVLPWCSLSLSLAWATAGEEGRHGGVGRGMKEGDQHTLAIGFCLAGARAIAQRIYHGSSAGCLGDKKGAEEGKNRESLIIKQ